MSIAFRVALVMLAVFALSVLLTPLFATLLPMFRFEKVFNRLIMVFTIGAAGWFVWKNKNALRDCGFDFSVRWKRLAAYGFFAGSLFLLSITAMEVFWGPRYVRDPLFVSDMIQRFFKGMLSGVVVGIVEEFFFRGFIFVQLAQKMKTAVAVVVASLFYSMVHFLDNGQVFIPPDPGFGDAWRLLIGYAEPVTVGISAVLPEFVGLFLFGVVLNIAFIRTGSLFMAIGIHAGVVFAIKWQNAFLRKGPDDYHVLFGSTAHYDGPVEWFFLALFGALLYVFVRRSSLCST